MIPTGKLGRRTVVSMLPALGLLTAAIVPTAGSAQTASDVLLSWNDGPAIGIDMFIGKRPYAAFGNSTGDREMLEWTGSGDGARLKMLVHHDDPVREYAYEPAGGLPDTKVGTFTQALLDEAKTRSWNAISMKNDWKRVFAFEPA